MGCGRGSKLLGLASRRQRSSAETRSRQEGQAVSGAVSVTAHAGVSQSHRMRSLIFLVGRHTPGDRGASAYDIL